MNYSEPYLPDAKDEIRSRIDIARVIGRYVKLKPAGQNQKGLCPFHKEKTPSFTVNPAKGVFHCFGCGKGGDVFAFLMEIEGLSFPEALQRMADETGVTLRQKQGASQQRQQERISKTEALAIHEMAVQFYYHQIKKYAEAVTYFKSRGLTAETVKQFRLGFAPDGWSNLIDYARAKKIPVDKLTACGLTVTSAQGNAPYDRFRNRIIFPIFDVAGKPIALAGRGMEKDAIPKYLNSPETLLYLKNRVLYGLNPARNRIKELGYCLVVEGYMDFLTLYQAGIHNVVATSGTALSEEHGHLLHRFTEKIVLVFDGDTAGYNAAERAVFILAPLQLDLRVLVLPQGEDPDSFVREKGPEPFLELVNVALPAALFLLQYASKKHDITTASGKSSVVDFCLPYLASLSNPIILATITKQIAEYLDLKEPLIIDALAKKKLAAPSPQPTLPPNFAERFCETEEGSFLHILIREPSFIPTAEKHISTETFTDFFTKNLYSLLIETFARDKTLDRLLDRTDNEDVRKVLSLMMVKEIATKNHQDEISHKVNRFLLKARTKKMHDITRRLRTEKDPVKKQQLLEEQKILSAQRGELI